MKDKQFVKLIFTNPNLVWASQWPRPRLGPAVVKLTCEGVFKTQYGYDLETEVYGKPTILTMDFAEQALRKQANAQATQISNFYMIGDHPDSDIAGGNAKGWTTILVRTGVFDSKAATSKKGNDKTNPATIVVEDF